ncbi:MAG: hypothetical protein H3C49_12365 [Alphaproteobacteria bacterium]|nr:hypothetical protein [Alphaproteobacteria bacterium]
MRKSLAVPVLLLFLSVQSLNHTGFCYERGRYLSYQELVDIGLFGEEGVHMSPDEKKAKEISFKEGADNLVYPECCSISREYAKSDKFWAFVDKTFIGRYVFQLNVVFPLKEGRPGRFPYEEMNIAVNACGKYMNDSYGMDISEKSYNSTLERNKAFWEAH